jgi:hemerythrin-like metal-binding protein
MALIEWKKNYSVGNAAVDHEHRELIDLINRLHGDLMAGSRDDEVSVFLGEIFRAISAHFALEELFMRQHAYDRTAEHKQAHEELLEQIRDIMEDFEANREVASGKLAARLDQWFTVHFKTHDARLHHRLGAHDHG